MLSKENQSKETSGTSPLECLLSQYKVDGFDPEAALTKVTEVDANGQPVDREYMKFQVMLAWFLTKFPEGCLNHTVFQLNERKAVVTGYIYRNQTDEKPAAVATCVRYFEESETGKHYVDNAVTAAYRKALGYLGFDKRVNPKEVTIGLTNGNEVLEEEDFEMIPRPAPMAIPHVVESVPVASQPDEPVTAPPEKKTRKRGRPSGKTAKDKIPADDAQDVKADKGPETSISTGASAAPAGKMPTTYTTEGGLKAATASSLSGGWFTAIPGVNCFDAWEVLLSYLKEQGVKTLVDAFDSDRATNEQVAANIKKLYEIAADYGFKMQPWDWGTEFKGCDDYLLAQKKKKSRRPTPPRGRVTTANKSL